MKVYSSIIDTIGNTPLVELINIENKYNLNARIIAKVESFNPAGSIKDRVAKVMLENAIQNDLVNKDTVIIEPTSGNTGVGLSMVAASKGMRIILTMPETMSIERRNLLKAYGAEVVLTDGSKGMKGTIEKANELAKEIPNSFIPSQFTNKDNPRAHYLTTGPEIYNDLDGQLDIFVAGVGTGGTLSGIGQFLKEKKANIKVVAVEPETSPVLSKGISGPHDIQGIGAGFVPDTLDTSIYDEIITVKDEDAYKFGREVAKHEGILIGISGGAAIKAAIELANRKENKGKTIVVILPDTGERYLSTKMFND